MSVAPDPTELGREGDGRRDLLNASQAVPRPVFRGSRLLPGGRRRGLSRTPRAVV
jgi:hypothetical protein